MRYSRCSWQLANKLALRAASVDCCCFRRVLSTFEYHRELLVRSKVEPSLLEAGFELEAKDYGSDRQTAWLDYARPGLTLGCQYQRCTVGIWLVAETMDDNGQCTTIGAVDLSIGERTTHSLLARIDDFAAIVCKFVQTLPAVTNEAEGGDR